MSKFFRRIRCGFTLIELLVVIAIISILAAILVPAVSDALLRGRLTQVMSNGKNLYVALFAKEMEDAVMMRIAPYPKEGAADHATMTFVDSTTFFAWVVTSGVMNVEFSFFASPGVPQATGTNVADFTAANNAWCITSGVGEGTPDGIPLFFTRNLNIEKLDEIVSTMTAAALAGKLLPAGSGPAGNTENTPFADKALVITFKGGATMAPRAKDVPSTFNRLNQKNDVLRPGAGY